MVVRSGPDQILSELTWLWCDSDILLVLDALMIEFRASMKACDGDGVGLRLTACKAEAYKTVDV